LPYPNPEGHDLDPRLIEAHVGSDPDVEELLEASIPGRPEEWVASRIRERGHAIWSSKQLWRARRAIGTASRRLATELQSSRCTG
jgi:hypothetical protein